MAELIHECEHDLAADGSSYRARVYGEQRGNLWAAWIEFSGGGQTRTTGVETTQPGRDAVAYWASGLEPVYLEGAWSRAKPAR